MYTKSLKLAFLKAMTYGKQDTAEDTFKMLHAWYLLQYLVYHMSWLLDNYVRTWGT